MRNSLILIILAAILMIAGVAFAQSNTTTISNLPPAGTLTGSEYVPVVQQGVTKRTTVSAFGSGGGGGGSVIWPSSNSIVISNSTNSPAGLAPVNGDCVIGSGSLWTAGSCPGGVGSSSAGQVLWNSAGSVAGFTMTGDCTIVASTGAITCTKSSGSAFGTAAFVNVPIAPSNGGTGLTGTPTNGQLLIGTGSGYALATLTTGTGINVVNGSGTITISSSGSAPTGAAGGDLGGTYPNPTVLSLQDVTTGGLFTSTVAPAVSNNILSGITIDPRDPKFGSNTCTGYYPIASSSLGVGGGSYAIGDKFFINHQTGTNYDRNWNKAIGTVTGVSGSTVTTYSLASGGGGYVTGSAVATTTITGSGSGLTINIGSIGTGNDDTAAFTNALAYAATYGGAVLVPNGCWIQNLSTPSNVVLVGEGWNPRYSYGNDPSSTLLNIIGSPAYGIKFDSANNVAFVNFEISPAYNIFFQGGGAYGSTVCIGTKAGAGSGGKIWMYQMSPKYCATGWGSIDGTGGYIFAVSENSDYGANQNGLYGPFSDLLSAGDTFVSGGTGLWLSSSAGGFARIEHPRVEYIGTGIRLDGGAFQTSLNDVQADRIYDCAIQANNAEEINMTGGSLKATGLDGTLTITNATSDGGLIQLTVTGYNSPPLTAISTGNIIDVAGVTGTTEANGRWTLTKINGTQLDLQSSTFTNAYISGGVGGVEMEDASICLSNVSDFHATNVGYYGTSAGSTLASAYILDSGSSSKISMTDGAANLGNVYGQGGYLTAFANWHSYPQVAPANVVIDVPGTQPFRNNNTAFSINSSGALGLSTTSASAGTVLDMGHATNALLLPQGTTGQRPTGIEGMFRYNTTTHALENYAGSSPVWGALGSPTWPANNDIVVSNTTNAPAGLAEVDGDCVVGTGGAWIAGSCTGPSGSGTVGSGTAPDLGYYATSTNTISDAPALQYSTTTTGLNLNSVNGISLPDKGADKTGISIGASAGLLQTTTALDNTAVGSGALQATTTGSGNTALGYNAGNAVTTASNTTLIGSSAASILTTGGSNTIIGMGTAGALTTGDTNVFIGDGAGPQSANGGSSSASLNISIGNNSGNAVPNNGYNTYIGYLAGRNMSGTHNVGVGYSTLAGGYENSSANSTAIGFSAGSSVTNGGNNTIVGASVGSTTLTTGSSNILIGVGSSTDTPASSTSNYLNIGNMILGSLTKGILILEGPTTTLTCGTSPTLKAGSNDMTGEVTVGTTASNTCVISFANTHTAAPNCLATSQTALPLSFASTTTALTVTTTPGPLDSTKIDYFCPGAANSGNPTP